MNVTSNQYRNYHDKDKTVSRPYHDNPYTYETVFILKWGMKTDSEWTLLSMPYGRHDISNQHIH